jgi:phenylalanyl-tRNA synthetase beta chain
VVDASNYVMLELGQPTHAYDFRKVASAHLGVRTARPGEQIVTLDEVTRTLGNPGRGLGDSATDLVIVDGNDAVIGIAGLMGGASTEIDHSTAELLLEAACFDSMTIARTSKKLGLRSEASNRFERGVDPQLATLASRRFFEVLSLSCPDLVVETPSVVALGDVAAPTVITASSERFGRLLGITLEGQEINTLLSPLGFHVGGDDGALQVTVPSNRPDIRPMPFGIADVAEEIVRTYGYARLERRFPSWPTPGSLTNGQRLRRQLREVLCGLGTDEVWTPTLVDGADAAAIGLGSRPQVTLANPLAEQEGALRSSLLPGMLAAIAYNVDRRNDAARFFEIGTVFTHPTATTTPRMTRAGSGGGDEAALPEERTVLSCSLRGATDDATSAVAIFAQVHRALRLSDYELVQPLDNLELPAALIAGAHPTRSAAIRCTNSGVIYGIVGEVAPNVLQDLGLGSERRVGLFMLDVTALETPGIVGRASLQANPISKFPSSDIDLAFTLADEVSAGALLKVLRSAASELCQSVELFDVYRGQGVAEGSRSLAYRLRFASLERTLTDVEVGTARANCIAAAEELGAVLR